MGREVLSHKIGSYGQFAMPTVDHDRKTHSSRSAKFDESVECCSYRAPCEQHIVDQHDQHAIEAARNMRRGDFQSGAQPNVIAVHADIDGSEHNGRVGLYFNNVGVDCFG